MKCKWVGCNNCHNVTRVVGAVPSDGVADLFGLVPCICGAPIEGKTFMGLLDDGDEGAMLEEVGTWI